MQSNQNVINMMHIISCALNNTAADIKLSESEISEIYDISKKHKITVLTAAGLKLLGYSDPKFESAYFRAVRTDILVTREFRDVCDYLENSGIWYMPLKGCVLKYMYPQSFLREMADNDILFDKEYRKTVKKFFLDRGYRARAYGGPIEDAYVKNPVYHFEMHVSLFDLYGKEKFEKYYAENIKYYNPDEGKLLRAFSKEDFLIYIVSHMSKHYINCGTGLRNLCDIYVYLTEYKDELDHEYIREEMEKAGILDFYEKIKKLSFILLEKPVMGNLDEESTELLAELFSSGVYGTFTKMIENRLDKIDCDKSDINNAKKLYIRSRIFPEREFYRYYCPFAFSHPWIIPFAWIKRTVRVVFKNSNMRSELRALKKIDNK